MSLTPDEAAKSLREVSDTELRAHHSIGYSRSYHYLFLLGLFWFICYGATQFWPDKALYIWYPGSILFVAAIIIATRWVMRGQVVSEHSRQIGRNLSIVFGFILPAFTGAVFAVMRPSGGEIGAFIPLLYASLYTGMGLWMGSRYVVVGVAVFIATLLGFYLLPQYFSIWMAIVGGGSMMLAGLWLRQV